MRFGFLFLIWTTVFTCAPELAYSQQDSRFRIVIVENGQKEFSIRLASEIRAQGMTSVIAETPVHIEDSDSARTFLNTYDAAALMEISPDGTRIVIYLRDSPVRPEILIDDRDEDTQSVFVFKSVEMVRAMLLSGPTLPPVAKTTKQPSPPRKPTPVVEAPRDSFRRVGLAAQPGMVHGSGSLPPQFCVGASILIRISRNLYISADGMFPVTRMELQKPEGKLAARATLAGLLLASSWTLQRTLEMHTGIGFSALFLSTRGIAEAPFISDDKLLTTALPQVNVGVSIGWSDRVRFRLDVTGGWTMHELKLRTAMGNETAYGPLILGVVGGIEAWLF